MRDKKYDTEADLLADFDLIWDNADAYNGADSWIRKNTTVMRRAVRFEMSKVSGKKRCTCSLSGMECVLPDKHAGIHVFEAKRARLA